MPLAAHLHTQTPDATAYTQAEWETYVAQQQFTDEELYEGITDGDLQNSPAPQPARANARQPIPTPRVANSGTTASTSFHPRGEANGNADANPPSGGGNEGRRRGRATDQAASRSAAQVPPKVEGFKLKIQEPSQQRVLGMVFDKTTLVVSLLAYIDDTSLNPERVVQQFTVTGKPTGPWTVIPPAALVARFLEVSEVRIPNKPPEGVEPEHIKMSLTSLRNQDHSSRPQRAPVASSQAWMDLRIDPLAGGSAPTGVAAALKQMGFTVSKCNLTKNEFGIKDSRIHVEFSAMKDPDNFEWNQLLQIKYNIKKNGTSTTEYATLIRASEFLLKLGHVKCAACRQRSCFCAPKAQQRQRGELVSRRNDNRSKLQALMGAARAARARQIEDRRATAATHKSVWRYASAGCEVH